MATRTAVCLFDRQTDNTVSLLAEYGFMLLAVAAHQHSCLAAADAHLASMSYVAAICRRCVRVTIWAPCACALRGCCHGVCCSPTSACDNCIPCACALRPCQHGTRPHPGHSCQGRCQASHTWPCIQHDKLHLSAACMCHASTCHASVHGSVQGCYKPQSACTAQCRSVLSQTRKHAAFSARVTTTTKLCVCSAYLRRA